MNGKSKETRLEMPLKCKEQRSHQQLTALQKLSLSEILLSRKRTSNNAHLTAEGHLGKQQSWTFHIWWSSLIIWFSNFKRPKIIFHYFLVLYDSMLISKERVIKWIQTKIYSTFCANTNSHSCYITPKVQIRGLRR